MIAGKIPGLLLPGSWHFYCSNDQNIERPTILQSNANTLNTSIVNVELP